MTRSPGSNAAQRRSSWLFLAAAAGPLFGPAAGAQWVEPPGKGWVSVAAYRQSADRFYDATGAAREFFAEGRARTMSLYATVAAGVLPGVDLWLQGSGHRLRYEDAYGARVKSGVGDARFWVRCAPLSWLNSGFPFALRAGVKAPLGDFAVGTDAIPLGDGQRDWEFIAEIGHSLWPKPVYLAGWLGYRVREENAKTHRDFGDEVFFSARAGAALGPVGVRLALEGMNGASGKTEGIRVPSFQREILLGQALILAPVGPAELELGLRKSFAGKGHALGTEWVVGYFARL